MIPLLIALLAAAEPPHAPPAPAAPPAVRYFTVPLLIDATNVELSGAGRLLFEGDGNPIAAAFPDAIGAEILGVVTFDHDGAPLGCTSEGAPALMPAGRLLCDQIVLGARFAMMPGFDLPFTEGRWGFTARMELTRRPVLPIRFLTPQSGSAFMIFDGAPGRCALLGEVISASDEQLICRAWQDAGRPGLDDGAADVWIEMQESARPEYRLSVSERPLLNSPDIEYTAPLPEIGLGLTSRHGQVVFSISEDDYPSRALRDGMEGPVTVLIGFERSGSPASCRPVRSSGSLYLDNATCGVVLRGARFGFAANAPRFRGVRYAPARIRWQLPQ